MKELCYKPQLSILIQSSEKNEKKKHNYDKVVNYF